MRRQRIYVHRYDWRVIVFYDSDRSNAHEILHELMDDGADRHTYNKAMDNLEGGLPDTGLTFTNPKERVTVVVLSHTSNKAEFANTWFHELLHAAAHIAQANGLPCNGEPIAYIGGELARAMQPVAALLMCPHCGE